MTEQFDAFMDQYRTFTAGRWLMLVILIVLFCFFADTTGNPPRDESRYYLTPYDQENTDVSHEQSRSNQGSSRFLRIGQP